MVDETLDWTGEGPAPLGVVVGGSLSGGLDIRLHPGASVEEAKVGTFVTVQGGWYRFFGIMTDMRLESSDPRFAAAAPGIDPAMGRIISGTSAYALARVTPMLTTSAAQPSPQPARSLPSHFAPVFRASNADVETIFGNEDAHHIYIGSPLDMEENRVCLDLAELVKRSNGVFGKSGTGKSFLTRILLAGILQKGLATNLVFDMHSEYGWESRSETGYSAKGLKQLFGSQVAVFTLDEQSSRRRGLSPDYVAQIGFDEIEPDEIAILAPTLNITNLGVQACYSLERHFGKEWVLDFLNLSSNELGQIASELRESPNTLDALRRGLRKLERFDFLSRRPPGGQGAVATLMEYLDRGTHVVLEFGRYGDELAAYLLVANLITRRIYDRYRRRTEEALSTNAASPTPLVVTIEEAHRFLTPQVASQTIFGTIAREMRKYNVTLLVVDQRPSGIDDEVLSQLGTRFTCQLDNERDVDAVLTGAPGSRELRTVLSRLEAQQQALVFGHALPMPVVVHIREYGPDFYAEMQGFEGGLTVQARRKRDKRDLFGKE
jgi:DNA helicase HerA-like ATPase